MRPCCDVHVRNRCRSRYMCCWVEVEIQCVSPLGHAQHLLCPSIAKVESVSGFNLLVTSCCVLVDCCAQHLVRHQNAKVGCQRFWPVGQDAASACLACAWMFVDYSFVLLHCTHPNAQNQVKEHVASIWHQQHLMWVLTMLML